MNGKQILLSLVLADFAGLTAWALYEQGLSGMIAIATGSPMGIAMAVDLTIAVPRRQRGPLPPAHLHDRLGGPAALPDPPRVGPGEGQPGAPGARQRVTGRAATFCLGVGVAPP
jgi:hypothetical protein